MRPTGLLDPAIEIRPARTQVDDLLHEVKKTTAAGWRTLVTTLTKRSAEELTTYLSELGIRVRYLHSEIDAIERAQILRDLATAYPNITAIRVRDAIDRVASVLRGLAAAISYGAAATLLTGFVVLIGG